MSSQSADAAGLNALHVEALFDEGEQDRIREAARSRAESPAAFLRDAVLDRVADAIGEEGHLECWVDGCEETFTSERRRRGHVGRIHSDNIPEGEFWCGICGYGPTTYPGIGSHHGHRHTGEDVLPLDHEPDRDELLDPDDVPDHMDRDLLERLYYECDGSYTEMCRRHDFGVTPGRVRHYLIEYGIHEVTPQGEGTDDHPVYRDRGWLKERYDAAGGNISEMHRNLDIEIAYRTLVKNVERFDFHDPTDPPGKRHGKGGPKSAPEYVDPPDEDDAQKADEPEPDDESVEEQTFDGSEPAFDHTDREDLRTAYERYDSIAAAAERFPDVSYATVRQAMIDANVHEPQSYNFGGEPDNPDVDEEFWCGRCGHSADSAVSVRRHNGQVHGGDPIVWDVEPADEDLVGDQILENPLDDGDGEDEATRRTIEWDFEPGFETVIEQQADDGERVLEGDFCPRCGRDYDGDGICEDCTQQLEGDVAEAGGFG